MHHPTDRIAHTTAFVTPVVEHWLEREIASKFGNTFRVAACVLVSRRFVLKSSFRIIEGINIESLKLLSGYNSEVFLLSHGTYIFIGYKKEKIIFYEICLPEALLI